MNGKTTSQHFVPQFYLREFGISKKQILEYDLKNNGVVHTKNIENSCCINNLYEYKSTNGTIIRVNEIEKILSLLETRVANTFRSIKSKAFCKNNTKIHCFLTTEEKHNLVLFIATLTFRNPELINAVISEFNVLYGSQNGLKPDLEVVTQYEKKNLALDILLPFRRIEESKIWKDFLSSLCDMSFMIVAVEGKDVFITSDKPAMVYSKKSKATLSDIDSVILPLTPRICLYLSSDRTKIEERNCLRVIDDKHECLKGVNEEIAALATKYLYTNKLLTSNEVSVFCRSYSDYNLLHIKQKLIF